MVRKWIVLQMVFLSILGVWCDSCFAEASQQTYNVKNFGAAGDGRTDDSAAVQKAIDTAVKGKGGIVYFPAGTYILSSINGFSNLTLIGEGSSSILKQKKNAQYILRFLSESSDTLLNQKNIKISKLTFQGRSVEDGFVEHRDMLDLTGVSNAVIDSCRFLSPQGDGIFLGSYYLHYGPRHNENIVISNNYFDGVNYANRNGISIIDGTNITIRNNYFTRFSLPDMPGPIDIEPDGYSFTRVNNITVDSNTFDNNGGIVAINVYIFDGNGFTVPPGGFYIKNNKFAETNSKSRAIQFRFFGNSVPYSVTESSPNHRIEVTDNIIEAASGKGIYFGGVRGVLFARNRIEDSNSPVVFGTTDGRGYENVRDITVSGNSFQSSNSSVGALVLGAAANGVISQNTFLLTSEKAIRFYHDQATGAAKTSSQFKLSNNQFPLKSLPDSVVDASLGLRYTLDTPVDGEELEGKQLISGWVVDPIGIAKVELFVDGKLHGQAEYLYSRPDVLKVWPQYKNGSSGFQYDLETRDMAIGRHEIKMRYTNNKGSQTFSKPITVVVNKMPAISSIDTVLPGQTISGMKDISGWYLDPDGAAKVEITIDGVAQGTARYGLPREDVASVYPLYNNVNSGYQFFLDTKRISNGTHQIAIQGTSRTGVTKILSKKEMKVLNH